MPPPNTKAGAGTPANEELSQATATDSTAGGGRIVLMIEWRKAVCASALDSTAKLVAHTIGAHMGADGIAWPSRTTIADEAGLGVRVINYATKRIEKARLLCIEQSRGRHSNRYRATLLNPAPACMVDPLNPAPGCMVEPCTGEHQPCTSRHQPCTGVHPKAVESGKAASSSECDADFTSVIAPLNLNSARRSKALAAWSQDPERVTALATKAQARATKSPGGLFAKMLDEGDDAEVAPIKRSPLEVALRWARGAGQLIAREDLLAIMPFAEKLTEGERQQVLAEVEEQRRRER